MTPTRHLHLAYMVLLAGSVPYIGAAPSKLLPKRGLLGVGSGTAEATGHQHEADAAESLPGMPAAVNKMIGPKCGTPYPSIVNAAGTMDVTHVTSMSGFQLEHCGACLEVTGPAGTTHVLLIDEKPGGGFDMAATAYNEISGQHVGPDAKGAGGVSVSYKEVDASACTSHWNGKCASDIDPKHFPKNPLGEGSGGVSHGNYCA